MKPKAPPVSEERRRYLQHRALGLVTCDRCKALVSSATLDAHYAGQWCRIITGAIAALPKASGA